MALRTLPPLPPASEKAVAESLFTPAAADAVRDVLARQVAARPHAVATVLYMVGLRDPAVREFVDALLALDAGQVEGRAA